MLKKYYRLTKPGIIRGNAITAIAGFFLASKGSVDFWLLLATLVGVCSIMASACVLNNYIDRDIDRVMARTKERALVKGTISSSNAIVFATLLGILGFWTLGAYTNSLTVLIGVIGFVDYIVLYGFSKRKSVHGTLVGSISGATPPVAGYCAVTGRFDSGALLLFLILTFWQMPHFYAIAIRRLKDYKTAKIPVLPVVKGMKSTRVQMVTYTAGFVLVSSLLTVLDYTGYTYLIVMLVVGLIWLRLTSQGFKAKDDTAWARQVFLFSLVVLLTFSIMISVDSWLP